MTTESFAAHLGTAVKTVATWHQKPGRVPSAEMQQTLDTTSLGVPSTHLLWLRDAVDRRDHAVTDTDMEAGLIAGQGTYRAVCGRTVPPCSMLTPPGPQCPACHERLAVPRKGRHRRRRRIVRCTLGEMMSAFRTSTSRPGTDTGRKST